MCCVWYGNWKSKRQTVNTRSTDDHDNICHNSLLQMNCISHTHIVILRLHVLIYNTIIVVHGFIEEFCFGEEIIDPV